MDWSNLVVFTPMDWRIYINSNIINSITIYENFKRQSVAKFDLASVLASQKLGFFSEDWKILIESFILQAAELYIILCVY